mgnify:CR=1 FL=1
MLIDKYIENALYLYQCVIIPGFGGFIATDQPQDSAGKEGKYSPRKKKFAFHPNLKVNDGVLAMYIANMREISYAEAMNEIAHAVDFYLSTLEKGDPVDIEGVGSIRPDGQGGLCFAQFGDKDFNRKQYGLSSTCIPQETPAGESAADIPDEKTYAHTRLQITPAPQEPDTENPPQEPSSKKEGVETVKKAFQMVVDAATSAGIEDNHVENRAIGGMINAVLMEAVEKATIDKYRADDPEHLRRLITSAADKAKKASDPEAERAIDSIVSVLMEQSPAPAEVPQEQTPAAEETSPHPEPAQEDGTASQDAPGVAEQEKEPEKVDPASDESAENIEDTGENNPADGQQENNPQENEEDEDEDEEHGSHFLRSKPVRIVIGAVVVLAVLAGLFFFVCRGGANLYFWKDTKGDAIPTAQPVLPAEDSLAVDSTAQNDTLPMTDLTPAIPAGDALDTTYLADLPFYVIATSVSVRENAEKALRELRQRGYPAVYAGYQNGLYLIAYQGFRSRSEAMKFYEEILNTTDNTQVWVKVYNRNADKKTD